MQNVDASAEKYLKIGLAVHQIYWVFNIISSNIYKLHIRYNLQFVMVPPVGSPLKSKQISMYLPCKVKVKIPLLS